MAIVRDDFQPVSEFTVHTAAALQGTLVICTRNRAAMLRRCLEGVRSLLQMPYEVLIIDNSNGDEETRTLADEFGFRYLIEAAPGLSRARNRGLAEAQGEIVAFLDDDAVPQPEWFGYLLSAFEDPQLGAASGRIVIPQMDEGASHSEVPRMLDKQNPKWLEIASFGGMGLGSNMALRRNASRGKKLFDERLGRGGPFQIGEEHYAFAYLISLGYSVRYIPEAIVFHPPLRRDPIEVEARNSIAYFLLLLAEFPSQRLNMLKFLLRRLRGKRLQWTRDSQETGDLMTSSLGVKCRAACSGLWVFIKTPHPTKR